MAPRTRSEFIDAITAGTRRAPGAVSSEVKPYDISSMAAGVQRRVLDPMQTPEPKDSNRSFWGPLGKAIDVIDTPRAMIASTVNEVADLVKGDGFSLSDWYNQSKDNMYMGEVFDKHGLKTGNKWADMGIGFIADVAIDPLTYIAGAGLALRGAKGAEIATSMVAKSASLRKAAKAASAAGDATKSGALLDRANKLTTAATKIENAKGAGTAAGREALAELGIDIGFRTTKFGTGRIGRKVVEKPLNKLTGGRLTRRLDVQRAKQVPSWIGDMEIGASASQISDAMAMFRRGDKALFRQLDEGVRLGARRAMTMPVQSKRFLGVVPNFIAKDGVLPWGKGFIQAVFPAPGKMMRAATQRGMIRTLDAALNQKQPIRALLASKNPDMVLAGMELRRANNGRIRVASHFKAQMDPVLKDLAVVGRRMDIPSADLMALGEMPYTVTAAGQQVRNPNLPQSIRSLPFDEGKALHAGVRNFWDKSKTTFNNLAGEGTLPDWVDDLYSARFLSDEGSELVFGGSSSTTRPFGGAQSPLKQRGYLSPAEWTRALDEFARAADMKSTGLSRSLADLPADAQAAVMREFEKNGPKKTFFGQPLVNVSDSGRSIRQQQREILATNYGDGAVELYEGDFLTVASRYLKIMGDEAGRHHMFGELRQAGILWDPNQRLVGVQLQKLYDSLAGSKNLVSKTSRQAARAAEAAEETGSNAPSVKSARMRAEVDDIRTSIAEVDVLLADAIDVVRAGRIDYMKTFAPQMRKLRQAEQQLDAVEAMVGWSGDMADSLTRAGSTGDWASIELAKEVQDARAAIQDIISQSKLAASLDPQVQTFKDVMRVLSAADDGSPVMKPVASWAKQVRELKRVEKELGPTLDLLTSTGDDLTAKITAREAAIAAMPPDDISRATDAISDLTLGVPDPKTGLRRMEAAKYATDDAGVRVPVKARRPSGGSRAGEEYYIPSKPRKASDMGGREGPIAKRIPPDDGSLSMAKRAELLDRWAADEAQQALNLQREAALSRRAADEATTSLIEVEAQLKAVNAEYLRWQKSDLLTERMGAAAITSDPVAAQAAALKVFNDHRMLRGFQTEFTDATSVNWGLSSLTVQAGAGERELFNAVYNTLYRVQDDGALKDFLKHYDSFMGWWKSGAVSSPGGFPARNFMGGAWVNGQIAGVEMGQHSKVWGMRKLAIKHGTGATDNERLLSGALRLAKEGQTRRLKGTFGVNRFRTADPSDWEHFNQIVESGIAQSGQVASEIETSLSSYAKLMRIGNWELGRLAPWSSEFAPFYKMRQINEQVEFMLRGGLGLDVMQKGGSLDDAVSDIIKYHFDYSPESLTRTERSIRRVIPFWRWTKGIIPVLIESMGRKPATWGRLQQLKGELEFASDPERTSPDYIWENMGVRLPFTNGGNRFYAMPDIGFSILNDIAKEPTSPLRMIAESAAPPLGVPLQVWAGKQVFGDIPFSGRYQQAPTVYDKIPGLMPILESMGKATKNKSGEYRMRDHDIYIMDAFIPMLGRARRMPGGNEERFRRRTMSTILSQVFGLSIRTNDQYEKRNQLRRDNEDFNKEWRDNADIQTRRV